jgi:hypothetical protein
MFLVVQPLTVCGEMAVKEAVTGARAKAIQSHIDLLQKEVELQQAQAAAQNWFCLGSSRAYHQH